MTQATTVTADDFFAGGTPAAKFEDGAYGTIIGGRITEDVRMTQQRDYTTGDLMFYPDNNPQMQMVVTVQAYDPSGDDDGRRSFYVKGDLKRAIGEALRKHNARKPERGGILQVKYVKDEPVTLKNGRPGNPKKIYAAKYEPPAAAVAGQFFDEPTSGASRIGTEGGAPPVGVDPATWSAMSPAQQAQMLQALGLQTPQAPAAGQFTDEPPF